MQHQVSTPALFLGCLLWQLTGCCALERAVHVAAMSCDMFWQQLIAWRVGKGRAVEAKELGNRTFAAKNYEEALQHFNTCIQLDPQYACTTLKALDHVHHAATFVAARWPLLLTQWCAACHAWNMNSPCHNKYSAWRRHPPVDVFIKQGCMLFQQASSAGILRRSQHLAP